MANGQEPSLAEQIVRVASTLPPERQREVLDFIEFLRTRAPAAHRARTPGLFAGQPYRMSDDFDEPLPESFWAGDGNETPR